VQTFEYNNSKSGKRALALACIIIVKASTLNRSFQSLIMSPPTALKQYDETRSPEEAG
jgi:hypothetical protein